MDDNLILRALMGAAGASVLAEIDLEKKREEVEDLRKELDAARAEIETLRKELDATNRFASTVASERDAAHAAATAQQRDEIAYLRARLDEERSVSAGLREQLDAARQTILAQKRGIQYLRLLIDKVRGIVGRDDAMSDRLEEIENALDEFDQGTLERETEPAPVAEPVDAEGGQ